MAYILTQLIHQITYPALKEQILSVVSSLWHDPDTNVAQQTIRMFLTMYKAGIPEIAVAFEQGNKLNLLNQITKLMNDESYENKETLQELLLFHASMKSK